MELLVEEAAHVQDQEEPQTGEAHQAAQGDRPQPEGGEDRSEGTLPHGEQPPPQQAQAADGRSRGGEVVDANHSHSLPAS